MKKKVSVSERALFARINRRLALEGQQMMRCSPRTHTYKQLGHYYIIDMGSNSIVARQCDLAVLARELECIRSWEELAG